MMENRIQKIRVKALNSELSLTYIISIDYEFQWAKLGELDMSDRS